MPCCAVSKTPPSSPGAGVLGGGLLKKDCCCQDTSFGGVFDLPPLTDDTEAYPKGSVQARLDAFLASRGAARKGCHATEMAGGGFAWVTDSDSVSFISDGRLSLALQGTAEGLEGEEDDKDGSGAEVRAARRAPRGARARSPRAQSARRHSRFEGLPRRAGALWLASRRRDARMAPQSRRGAHLAAYRAGVRAGRRRARLHPSTVAPADAARHPAQRSAWSILGFYYDHAEHDLDVLKSELVAGLSSLSGTWAFVLHDRKARLRYPRAAAISCCVARRASSSRGRARSLGARMAATLADACAPLLPLQRHRVVAAASKDGSVGLQWGCVLVARPCCAIAVA